MMLWWFLKGLTRSMRTLVENYRGRSQFISRRGFFAPWPSAVRPGFLGNSLDGCIGDSRFVGHSRSCLLMCLACDVHGPFQGMSARLSFTHKDHAQTSNSLSELPLSSCILCYPPSRSLTRVSYPPTNNAISGIVGVGNYSSLLIVGTPRCSSRCCQTKPDTRVGNTKKRTPCISPQLI